MNLSTCDRCGAEDKVTVMSKFNRDVLCLKCKGDEVQAPNYAKADMAEIREVHYGNYNFAGIGLAPEDAELLAERRKAREVAASDKRRTAEAASGSKGDQY